MSVAEVSLAEARERGLKRYFTGKPCPKGHVDERMVSNRRCVRCLRIDKTEWGRANPEKVSAREKRLYPKNRAKKIANAKRWHENNPDRAREHEANYRARNKEKVVKASLKSRAKKPDYYKGKEREWRLTYPEKNCAKSNKYRARKANPHWVDQDAIKEVYALCPPDKVVDHIVPLKGRTVEGYRVSGLHVPWNLQYISAIENSIKHNRMRPEEQALCESSVWSTYDAVLQVCEEGREACEVVVQEHAFLK